jgi:hypothetical protein
MSTSHTDQEELLVHGFQNSYLLLRRLEWIDESERPNGSEFDLPHADAELYRFDHDGDVKGATSSRVRPVTPDDDWRFKPREVLYPWPVDPRKPVMGILPLGEIALSQLSDAKSEELRAFRSQVLESVFVGQNPDQFFPQHFLSIIYIEPPEELLAVNSPRADCLALIQLLRKELDQTTYVSVPQLFEDLVVFPGPLGPNISQDLLVVRRAPLNRPNSPHAIPQSVLTLSELLSVVPGLDATSHAIKGNPLFQQSPSEYLTMLTKDLNKRRHRVGMRRDRGLALAYERHLKERMKGIDAYASVRSLAENYKRANSIFKENALRQEDDWLWQSEMVSDGKYRYGVISTLWSRLTKAGEEIEQATAELDVREHAVSEYLRDYFNAEVARSNLAVQRAVHRLTVVAILIALIALLMQLPLATIKAVLSR